MADDIGSGDPREEAARRRQAGMLARARARQLAVQGGRELVPQGGRELATQGGRELATGGSGGGGGGGRSMVATSAPEPSSPGGGQSRDLVTDRRIPLNGAVNLGARAAGLGRYATPAGAALGVMAPAAVANAELPAGYDGTARPSHASDPEAAPRTDREAAVPTADLPPTVVTARAPRRPARSGRRELTADELNARELDRQERGATVEDTYGPGRGHTAMKKGGKVKAKNPFKPMRMAKGGVVKAPAARRGDGICRVKTRGRMV